MRKVLVSVRPQWCEKICNYEKTTEVRKTAPKEIPFKCYIYCTKNKPYLYREANGNKDLFLDNDLYRGGSYESRFLSGKVIGEFICNSVTKYPYELIANGAHLMPYGDLEKTCLDGWELYDYLRIKLNNKYARFFYTKGRDFRLGQFNQRKSKGIFKKNERKKNLYKAY